MKADYTPLRLEIQGRPNIIEVGEGRSITIHEGEASRTFTDTPLTDIVASATSEATGGTKSTVSCVDGSNAAIGNSPQGLAETAEVTATGLRPGSYTCTIVVDP